MRAVTTAGGGVMFIADEIERTTAKISYKDLVKDEPKPSFVSRLLGKRSKTEKTVKKAA